MSLKSGGTAEFFLGWDYVGMSAVESKPKRLKNVEKRVSLKDIARACALSVMTVSRALNNAYGIHSKTRERVLQVAREMGYVPNRLASNLVQRKTMTIGVVIPDVDHSIFPALLAGLEQVLSAEDYHLFLCCSYDRPDKEFREVMALVERRVDGILLAPSSVKDSRQIVERVQELHCPLVLVDRLIPGVTVDSVSVDDYRGAQAAVSHLIARGYRRIAHIAGPQSIWTARERQRGYQAALKKAGIAPVAEYVVTSGLTVDGGENAMEQILNLPTRPDAVFCVNDPAALGAIKALGRAGLAIPGDMALVGFSNVLETELLAVPLTTVTQDAGRLGREAATLLLQRLRDEASDRPTSRQVIPTELVVRRSS
jgi:LacI family transcriptional regulator